MQYIFIVALEFVLAFIGVALLIRLSRDGTRQSQGVGYLFLALK